MPGMQKVVYILLACICLAGQPARAQQDATVSAHVDAGRIVIGERARVFIELQHNSARSRVEWSVIPDTFNSLEVVAKSLIDTLRQGDIVTYKQQLQVTGFDSGSFVIPPFSFTIIPAGKDTPYIIRTEPHELLLETVPVDTTQGYKGIKEIIYVEASWLDHIGWIAGGAALLAAIALIIYLLARRKKRPAPVPGPSLPPETMQQKYFRLLQELEQQQLWQGNQVKAYYVALTDVLRNYIEERFRTPAMELTTDEILDKARIHTDMRTHLYLLEQILRTADLAKFAKAQPLPHEHAAAMDATRKFITVTLPEIPDVKNKQ